MYPLLTRGCGRERELVQRERSEADQRIVRVRLTTEGQRVLRAAPTPAAAVIPAALNRMPADTLFALSHELTTLLELMGVSSWTLR